MIDFLSIGESLRDTFYFIDEASVSCTINKEHCLLCLEYAEKIPVRAVVKIPAAGNAANAAVTAARLGLKPALMSWVGDDIDGQHLKIHIKEEGIDVRHVCTCQKEETSEATILSFQGEKTQLVSFKPRTYRLPTLPKARAIYYSAMGDRFATFDRSLIAALRKATACFFIFQPGTTHIRAGLKAITPLIARADLLVLNIEEGQKILATGERPVKNMLDHFHAMGAKNVVITNGKEGAQAYDGKGYWHMPIFPGDSIESTGAGDAFASATACAMLRGKPLPEALRWGAANAQQVVLHTGPQEGIVTMQQMDKLLKKHKAIVAHAA